MLLFTAAHVAPNGGFEQLPSGALLSRFLSLVVLNETLDKRTEGRGGMALFSLGDVAC